MAKGRRRADDLVGRLEALQEELRRARHEAAERARAVDLPGAPRAQLGLRRLGAAVVLVLLIGVGLAVGLVSERGEGRHGRRTAAVRPPAATGTVQTGSSGLPPAPPPLPPAPPPQIPPPQLSKLPAPATWTVQPGDSFWTIAEAVVRARLASSPGTGQVARYWMQLIAANDTRLPVPGNPDLILPGTVMVLPGNQ